MKKNEQGVLKQNKFLHLLVCILLPIIFNLPQNISADTVSKEKEVLDRNRTSHHIHLIYSSDSSLQSTIAREITKHLNRSNENARITQASPKNSNTRAQIKPELIIAIGIDSIRYADINFTKTDALLIASNPGAFKYNEKSDNNDAVLFMSQSYCRQIRFINEINDQWNTIGFLNNKEKPVDNKAISRCARRYGMNTYMINAARGGNVSHDIKHVLKNADLILALPNKNIYNNKSVKNILLTSYRNRKPVIGFSKNFVNAGALAAIQSDAEQIADSAISIIEKYYKQENNFRKKINHPRLFDISINKQVFRALNLPLPDIEKLKQSLSRKNLDKPGELR
ncbi:MAG: hypothetical protein KAJ32_08865 [Gammaproteobacteria bacterium]|nr:hypothetical protein [Gammaproteobacteria bacterium]